jgi:hemerythrin
MPIAIWTPSLETGYPKIDAQHKRLFEMINDLHHGVIKGDVQEILGTTLKRLVAYTINHFEMEEDLMASTKYPKLSRHRPKHAELMRKVKKLAESYDAGEISAASSVSKLLGEWLIDHIHQEDTELAKWVKEHGSE